VALVFITAIILHYGNFYFMLSFRTHILHYRCGVFFILFFVYVGFQFLSYLILFF
jgi:uncharacterized protein YqhQ